jgi:hypothetical protein
LSRIRWIGIKDCAERICVCVDIRNLPVQHNEAKAIGCDFFRCHADHVFMRDAAVSDRGLDFYGVASCACELDKSELRDGGRVAVVFDANDHLLPDWDFCSLIGEILKRFKVGIPVDSPDVR